MVHPQLTFYLSVHLNIPLEVAGDERPEAPPEGQPVVMREHHSSVEDGGVDEIKGAEIIF